MVISSRVPPPSALQLARKTENGPTGGFVKIMKLQLRVPLLHSLFQGLGRDLDNMFKLSFCFNLQNGDILNIIS